MSEMIVFTVFTRLLVIKSGCVLVIRFQDKGKNHEGPRMDGDHRNDAKNNEDVNYEEEEEEGEEDADKGNNRRAEM